MTSRLHWRDSELTGWFDSSISKWTNTSSSRSIGEEFCIGKVFFPIISCNKTGESWIYGLGDKAARRFKKGDLSYTYATPNPIPGRQVKVYQLLAEVLKYQEMGTDIWQ
jgi:hypothetical protein